MDKRNILLFSVKFSVYYQIIFNRNILEDWMVVFIQAGLNLFGICLIRQENIKLGGVKNI